MRSLVFRTVGYCFSLLLEVVRMHGAATVVRTDINKQIYHSGKCFNKSMNMMSKLEYKKKAKVKILKFTLKYYFKTYS